MATLRLFAAARESAGTGKAQFDGATVSDVLSAAVASYGEGFQAVLAEPHTAVGAADEVAVLPPVSGGCT